MEIIWLNSIDSTNNEAARRMDSLDNLSVIAAKCQTHGRGQRGNSWLSGAGENLTFSMVLKFSGRTGMAAKDQFALSQAASLAVVAFLEENGIRAMIKWPNDIYVGDRKICGMLIENTLAGAMIATSIVGIGLNLNQTAFPGQVLNPVSARLLTGRTFDVESSLERLAGLLEHYFSLAADTTSGGCLNDRYISLLYRRGERHDYTDCRTGEVFQGIIKGITPEAKLVVETSDGACREFYFKEISYII